MSRLPASWIFVTTGILFNILSAVFTHYFIGLNNEQIVEIDRNINNKQILIDSLWQSKTEIERKKEFFILSLALRKDSQPSQTAFIEQYYRNYIATTAKTYDLPEFEKHSTTAMGNSKILSELSQAAQTGIIDTINATYFEKIQLEDEKIPIEKSNARLFSIAIFLQLTGLILILARDLKKT